MTADLSTELLVGPDALFVVAASVLGVVATLAGMALLLWASQVTDWATRRSARAGERLVVSKANVRVLGAVFLIVGVAAVLIALGVAAGADY